MRSPSIHDRRKAPAVVTQTNQAIPAVLVRKFLRAAALFFVRERFQEPCQRHFACVLRRGLRLVTALGNSHSHWPTVSPDFPAPRVSALIRLVGDDVVPRLRCHSGSLVWSLLQRNP